MVHPLQKLILDYKPRNRIEWAEELKSVFLQVQESVNNAPPLQFVDYEANLFQMKEGVVIPIAFISKALNSTEARWSTPEQVLCHIPE